MSVLILLLIRRSRLLRNIRLYDDLSNCQCLFISNYITLLLLKVINPKQNGIE